jgi:dihydroorotate dehydrogenase (NAD+) catalytic subunit
MTALDLTVQLGPLALKNPVMVASGIFGYGDEFRGLADYGELGALVLKTVTPQPRPGNAPAHRTVETPAGMLNAIGLENVGLDAFIRDKLPAALAYGTHIIASVAGDTPEEFARCAHALDSTEIAAIEINISCPNVEKGGMAFGVDPEASAEVVSAVRAATKKPIIPKLTPNVTDIGGIALSCQRAGADAISLINTFAAMAIDTETRRPLLAAVHGGLSGPAIRPAAVYRIYQVAQAVELPVIGMGGIWNANDALEFIIAGATAVAVGTALYADPTAPHHILAGIRGYLEDYSIPTVAELVGSLVL